METAIRPFLQERAPRALTPPSGLPATYPSLPALPRIGETKRSLREPVTVNHQGTVIAFARDATPGSTDVYYDVLDLQVGTLRDNQEWTGFEKLAFPDEVRDAGLGIVTLDDTHSSIIGRADAPLRAISDGRYVCLFSQSNRGTLLLNRFMLKRLPDPSGGQPIPTLEPVWEVRFQRSGKQDIPAGIVDSQTYLTPDGKPFIEPTIELPMIRNVEAGRFEALILPDQTGANSSWQFFAYDKTSKKLNLFNFPMDASGLFDLSQCKLDDNGNVVPDVAVDLSLKTDKGTVPTPIAGIPRATLYALQERVQGNGGDNLLLKRAARVLMTVPVDRGSGDTGIATLDFALSADGRLAQILPNTVTSAVSRADDALAFDATAYLALPNNDSSLSLKGAFSAEFWVYLTSPVTSDQYVFGGDRSVPAANAAPYVKINRNLQIEVGFGDGGKAVSARTKSAVVAQSAWAHVYVAFDTAKSPYTFSVEINGNAVDLDSPTASSVPSGTPISLVGGTNDGIIGLLDFLRIWNGCGAGAKIVGDWEFDTVDYSLPIPVTPDVSPFKNDAKVFGATLAPSSAPVATNSGEMQIDPNGLTIYAGVLDFAKAKSSPTLLTGSDGLVHLYFQGLQNELCVAQLNAESSRAVFQTFWKSTTDQGTQSGAVNMTAARSGAYMNGATVAITPSAVADLCDLRIDNAQGLVETWKGVPRSLSAFNDVLNGASTNNLDDPRFKAGRRTFYDSTGTYRMSRLPIDDATPNTLTALCRFPDRLEMRSIQIARAGDQNTTLTFTFRALKWDKQSTITQTWPQVPIFTRDALTVLSGTSTTYDYSSATSADTAVYRLRAVDASRSAHFLRLITRSDVTEVSVAIADGTTPDRCTATVKLIVGGETVQQVLPDMSRDQNAIAVALESGPLAPYVVAITDGLTAAIENRAAGTPDRANMLAWAAAIDVFTDLAPNVTSKLREQGPISAEKLQQASYVDRGTTYPLDGGSTLFRCAPDATPTNGGVALLQDTAALPHGNANAVVLATNGGWINRSPHKAIALDGKNAVLWDPRASTADRLALAGDVSLEAWCRPVAPGPSTNYPRMLSYNRLGNIQLPDEPITYALGLAPAPCLAFTANTAMFGSYDLSEPDCSMQIWMRPTLAMASGIVMQLSTTRVIQPYLTLEVDATGVPVVTYGTNLGRVTGTTVLDNTQWYQLTITLQKDPATPNVHISLYVNGQLEGVGDFTEASFPYKIGSFAAGDTARAFPMWANGVLMWRRALSAGEVARSVDMTPQRNDFALVIAWYLTEGSGSKVVNRALDGVPIVTDILNQPETDPWPAAGIYSLPWASNRSYGLLARSSPILGSWSHVASTYRSAFALQLGGADYADCGNDPSLDFDTSFTLEAWCRPSAAGVVQTLISKPGNYELALGYDNTLMLSLWTSAGFMQLSSKTRLSAGQAYYVAATANAQTKQSSTSGTKKPQYVLDIKVYVNGEVSNSFYKDDYSDAVTISTSKDRLNLGRSSLDAAYFHGAISDVRLWKNVLDPQNIAQTYRTHRLATTNGIVSYWRFSEMSGKYAYDQNNLNNAVLSSNELWRLFPPASSLQLLVNGDVQTDAAVVDAALVGGYGSQQLTVGALRDGGGALTMPFFGQLNEVRVWNTERTPEQIDEDMFRELAGNETGLAGYWPFDAGSGTIASDATGRGNNGQFFPQTDPPRWVSSDSPVSNEAREVYNVLGGVKTPFVAQIDGPPCVVEYSDTRRDAYGQLFSVMKRCYAFDSQARVDLVTGFMVGDLDTIYAGQVQMQPSLIGYIEGAPPIPSENQTNPWWNDVHRLNTYADTFKVAVTQAQSTIRAFSGGENTSNGASIGGKVGLALATGTHAEEGVAAGEAFLIGWETWKLDGKFGYQGDTKTAVSQKQDIGFGFGTKTVQLDEMTTAGAWEPTDAILNPEVGRRYVPENIGYALVKSLTANMYFVRLRGSSTVVKTVLVPDPDIPEDVNIITFPIDPSYVKNGTLDGKVGFKNDPDYRYADVAPGSYFKPLQAYSLKRAIERQDRQLEAYYQQFDTSNYSKGLTITIRDGQLAIRDGFMEFRDDALPAQPSYDWKQRLAKRSLVNTYVWTATGGMHKEQTEAIDTYEEAYSGVSGYDSSNGVAFDLSVTFVAGVYGEFDALWNTSLEIESIKRKESENSFGLEVEFEPDRFLKRPIVESGVPVGYTDEEAPGKVDGYRFMSFFVAPSLDNFALFQNVVDQNWLNNSADPNAAALLTATAAQNGAWRVAHRVTYVSRIPPSLQPAPAQTAAPDITPPANLPSNTVIVRMIERLLPATNPSPAQIGQAVNTVLGESSNAPGLLANVLPWWKDFVTNAYSDQRSTAYRELSELRSDLLDYMNQAYAAKAYEGGGALVAQLRLSSNKE